MRQGGAGDLPVADRCFVFVAADADTGEVVGTSMVFAQHGSRRAPHVFFEVLEEERYSETLDRHFVHRVLRIGYNYKGLTEIGGLVVRRSFGATPRSWGGSSPPCASSTSPGTAASFATRCSPS